MQKKSQIRILVGLVVAIVIGAVIGAIVMRKLRYDVEFARRGDIVEAVYGIGSVATDETFVAKVAMPVQITKTYAPEGADVKAGDKLLRLDTGAYIRTPINGKVTQLLIHSGENASPGQELLHVQDLQSRYIRLLLDQESALRVKPGQPVKIGFESVRGVHHDGVVKFVYPSNGRFVVRIDSDQLPDEILPGMAADIGIEVNRRTNALLVPLSTVNNGVIQRIRADKRSKINVTIGSIEGQWAEVTAGDIALDDELIVRKTRR